MSQVELGKATKQLSLSKPAASRGGRPPSVGGNNSPTRPQGLRVTRASGSGASLASTALISPRTSAGSNVGGGGGGGRGIGSNSFGYGRSSVSGSRVSMSGGVSPTRQGKKGTGPSAAGAVASRSRLSSCSASSPPSPQRLDAVDSTAGGVSPTRRSGVSGARAGSSTAKGRTSTRGGARPSVGGSRMSVSSRLSQGGQRDALARRVGDRESTNGVARPSVGAEGKGGRASVSGGATVSGSTRRSSAISKAVPPSPKRESIEKRPRLSGE